jgi:hypothetical protein
MILLALEPKFVTLVLALLGEIVLTSTLLALVSFPSGSPASASNSFMLLTVSFSVI